MLGSRGALSEYSPTRLGSLRGPLQDELSEAITSAHGETGTGAMAYELLRRDKRSYQLGGVV